MANRKPPSKLTVFIFLLAGTFYLIQGFEVLFEPLPRSLLGTEVKPSILLPFFFLASAGLFYKAFSLLKARRNAG